MNWKARVSPSTDLNIDLVSSPWDISFDFDS